jgi:hypothetical protein
MATELMVMFEAELVVVEVVAVKSSKPLPFIQAVILGASKLVSQLSGGTGTWNCTVTTRPLRETLLGASGCQQFVAGHVEMNTVSVGVRRVLVLGPGADEVARVLHAELPFRVVDDRTQIGARGAGRGPR